MKPPSVSCVFPCLNDRGTIAGMVLAVHYVLTDAGVEHEIVVVDDGSTDGARELLTRMAESVPPLRVVVHDTNRGYGGAIASGFAACTKDWIFYTDGDAQYDPAQIALLLPEAADDVDVVQGYKLNRGDPPHRILLGAIYQYLMRFAFNLSIRDVDCDFRLIRRAFLDRVVLTRRSGAICVEMCRKFDDAGARIREVGVRHTFRVYGKSQIFNVKRLVVSLAQLGGLWWELVARPRLSRSRVATSEPRASEPRASEARPSEPRTSEPRT
ncbi:glycosyltransferase family 2 protein [bacterium]|nr:glycosyltransferase family 2 protein [bacterium]